MSELALLVASNWFAANLLSSSLLPRFVLAGPLFALGLGPDAVRGDVRKIARDRGGNFESVNVRFRSVSPREILIRFRWHLLRLEACSRLSSGFNYRSPDDAPRLLHLPSMTR